MTDCVLFAMWSTDLKPRRKKNSGGFRPPEFCQPRSCEASVLQARRRAARRERPYAVGELERQEAVVLARGLQAGGRSIETYLRRTPVRSAGNPAAGRAR